MGTDLNFSIDTATSGLSTPEVCYSGSYAAATEKRHRRPISPAIRDEDNTTTPQERRKLTAVAESLRRNFEVPGWGLRLHLDYVTGANFQATGDSDEFNADLEAFIENWSKAENCDAAGRHSLPALARLWEAHRSLGGDAGVYKLKDGTIQLIEGDKLRNPPTVGDVTGASDGNARWVHGVKVNGRGGALAFAIHKRQRYGGYEFDRTVPSSWMQLFAYRTRYDQVRGISPLTAALDRFRDVYEGLDLNLQKAKNEAQHGLAVFRKYRAEDGSELLHDAEDEEARFRLDPNKGVYTLDLLSGDKVQQILSSSPNSTFTDYTRFSLAIGLLAFDLPYAFFDSSEMNFSTMKTALTLYLKRCADKRRENRELRDHLTRWRVGMAVANGELKLPRKMRFSDIKWLWVPDGLPYFDKGREVPGDLAAVEAGFQTPGQVIEERFGMELRDFLRRRKKEDDLAASFGYTLPAIKSAVLIPAAGDAPDA
jgi:capsid protein